MNSKSFPWPAVLALAIFSAASMFCASRKPLWLDEYFGFQATRAQGWESLVTRGAATQASPSPLFYVLVKSGQPFTQELQKAGVPSRVYSRWVSLGPAVLGTGLLFALAPASLGYAFLFSKALFVQSYEARPYALWLMLTFLFLVILTRERRGVLWTLICLAIGLTATASLFQLVAAGACLWWGRRLFQAPPESRLATYGPLVIGAMLAAYYALYSGRWGYGSPEWGTWKSFGIAFARQAATIVGGIALLWEAYKNRNEKEWVLYATILSWFAMSPGIYMLTRARGVFFHERHYMYWTAAAVIVLWGVGKKLLSAGWPGWRSFARRDQAFLGLLFLFCLDRVGPHHALWELLKYLR